MVDRVLVSCYANVHHDLAHLTMIPMQRFSEAMMRIFGDDTGIPVYVKIARALGTFLPVQYIWTY